MNIIGNVKLEKRLILAPMANILDLPLRLTFKEFGFGLTSIGSISAEAVVEDGKGKLINLCGKEEFTDERESLVSIQLIGSDEYIMARAAELVAKKADIIDLNFGCPIKWVIQKGWGAALLEDLPKMQAIIKAVVKNVDIPVTAKIRLHPAGSIVKTIDIAHCCEDAGIAALTVHTRTPEQKYSGKAHWDILPEIKKRINIPIIGNGNVCNLDDAGILLDKYGCDFVMTATAAIRNPLAFVNKADIQDKATMWRFASCYARYSKKQVFYTPLALARFMLIRLQVNSFVRYSLWM